MLLEVLVQVTPLSIDICIIETPSDLSSFCFLDLKTSRISKLSMFFHIIHCTRFHYLIV
jgi:hypothetical protein